MYYVLFSMFKYDKTWLWFLLLSTVLQSDNAFELNNSLPLYLYLYNLLQAQNISQEHKYMYSILSKT
jgi:hypothetical protein